MREKNEAKQQGRNVTLGFIWTDGENEGAHEGLEAVEPLDEVGGDVERKELEALNSRTDVTNNKVGGQNEHSAVRGRFSWGICYSLGQGWAFNGSGHQGVQLDLTNDKRILIGAQRIDELARAIGQAKRQAVK